MELNEINDEMNEKMKQKFNIGFYCMSMDFIGAFRSNLDGTIFTLVILGSANSGVMSPQ